MSKVASGTVPHARKDTMRGRKNWVQVCVYVSHAEAARLRKGMREGGFRSMSAYVASLIAKK